jgi:hypothetical protein
MGVGSHQGTLHSVLKTHDSSIVPTYWTLQRIDLEWVLPSGRNSHRLRLSEGLASIITERRLNLRPSIKSRVTRWIES